MRTLPPPFPSLPFPIHRLPRRPSAKSTVAIPAEDFVCIPYHRSADQESIRVTRVCSIDSGASGRGKSGSERDRSIDDLAGPSSLFPILSPLRHVNSRGNLSESSLTRLQLNEICIYPRREGAGSCVEAHLQAVHRCHFVDVPDPLSHKARQSPSTAASSRPFNDAFYSSDSNTRRMKPDVQDFPSRPYCGSDSIIAHLAFVYSCL